MKPNKLLNGRFRPLAGLLLRVATLCALAGSAPAWAVDPTVFPNLGSGQYCMGDVAGSKVNCTANDVSITAVTPSPDANGNPVNVSCSPGTTFTFDAEVTVQTTASARYDTTFYLPLTAKSPKEVQGKQCGILLPVAPPTTAPNVAPYQSYVRIDNDSCADITKSVGPGSYVIHKVPITMFCQPAPSDPSKALFSYCAAWDNKEVNGNCKGTSGGTLTDYAGAAPGTPSKCNCASFAIDVTIIPPGLNKTVDQPTSRPEPGGAFTYHLSFTNPSSVPITLSSLKDAIDLGNNGYDSNLTVDLWGATMTDAQIDALPDGVYLRSTNCLKPVSPATTVSIGAGATYSCDFTLRIKDRDLPDDQSAEIYDDTVVGHFMTQGNPSLPVGDGTTCSLVDTGTPVPGNICSQEQRVTITNVAPSITVTKTPDPDQVKEPGGSVEYTVVVTNTSGDFDNPLTLTSLIDDKFGDLDTKGDCALGSGVSLAKGSPFTCHFTETINGNSGDTHTNEVTAMALDNEGDDATAKDSATVSIVDVPSAITLLKDANPESVAETGDKADLFRDVAYTFTFSVGVDGVDEVTFNSLTDDVFGDLTALCMVDKKDGQAITPVALVGFKLLPGHYASCTITKQLQGNAGDSHTNVATIDGMDADGQEVSDDDDATVTFTDEPPTMDRGFALKATVFLKVKNTSIETIHLTGLQVLGVPVEDASVFGVTGFVIRNEGGSFGSASPGVCQEPPYGLMLAPDEEYSCAFSVEFAQDFTPSKFNTFTSPITGSDSVKVEFADDENNPVSGVASVTITTP
ncbi:DUF7507 domain-containing protein [Aeromonas taiwanensis]|uniref:DUF7507 domain-containing protein n=1 Tax=Aeromonas taiwanensis TaxID=633417 RepID=UPI003BA3DA88